MSDEEIVAVIQDALEDPNCEEIAKESRDFVLSNYSTVNYAEKLIDFIT